RLDMRVTGGLCQPGNKGRIIGHRQVGPGQVIMRHGVPPLRVAPAGILPHGACRFLASPRPDDGLECRGLEVTWMSTEQQHLDAGPALAGGAGDDLELDREEWAAVRPREITPERWSRFEGYMLEIFTAMGMPAGTVSTADTTRRFLRAIYDATSGYEGDEKLVTAFPTECHGGPDCRISQMVEGPIPFFALCEHHSLPFFGRAYVGYTVQERIGQQLADALERILQPHGVAVHLEAVHVCMQMRGVREIESSTRTTYWRGNYDEDPDLRAGFFRLCGRPG